MYVHVIYRLNSQKALIWLASQREVLKILLLHFKMFLFGEITFLKENKTAK
jgi:hypothetical protein